MSYSMHPAFIHEKAQQINKTDLVVSLPTVQEAVFLSQSMIQST